MPLNDDQLRAAAASTTAPQKIIAGAGAGKTETLAARFVEMVREGIAPERIVLLTFTEDAAAEMRARVMLRLREAAVAVPAHALLDPWIATFHGFAMRLLREHGFDAALPPTPRVLADEDQAELRQAIRDAVEAGADLPPGYAPLDHTIYRWDTDEAWSRTLATFDALRRGGGAPHELEPHPQLHAHQSTAFAEHRAQLVPLIEHVFGRYTAHLRVRGVLDYDEILQAALRLLRAQPAIAGRFDVVMVDEFQDTNRPQLALLEALQPGLGRTTVVGDPRQAIYGWNSARAESIYRFPFLPDGAARYPQHDLVVNYRSHPAIVRIATWALRGSELGALKELAPAPDRAALRPAALADEPVVSLHQLPTVEHEAQLIAAEIGRLTAKGLRYADMAVLLRARTQLPPLLNALRLAGIPYTVNGGAGFYLHWAIRLTSSLLRLLADPAAPAGDAAAWAHILESPLVGLDPTALRERDTDAAGATTHAYLGWLAAPETLPTALERRAEMIERLQAFGRFFAVGQARWGLVPPGDYLQWLWQASGILTLIDAMGDTQARLALRQLEDDADAYAAAHPLDGLDGFAALLQEQVRTQPRVALPTPPHPDAVEIATVHQAKGREWPVVFVYNTALPGGRSGSVDHVLWDEQWKLVISDSSKAADKVLQELRSDFRRRNRNEERSIWYVALTRAQERLYLVHSGCPLDGGEFADARAKLGRLEAGAALTRDDEGVHFFHELWQHIRAAPPDPLVVLEPPTTPAQHT